MSSVFDNPHDNELLDKLLGILTDKVKANPYSAEPDLANEIQSLPVGLRAMAATHWLDLSLTIDSMTWHFGNFGEPGLVAATYNGLIELGLTELAACFAEARDFIQPILRNRKPEDGDLYEIVEKLGLGALRSEIDARGEALAGVGPGETSTIYTAWIQYAREHPDRIF